MVAMPPLTDQLCTQCGLCCDGTLLADVELASRREAASMEALGMAMDEDGDGDVMLLPCVGLKEKRCTVYRHRPKSCRAFECKLLQDAQAGKVTVGRALEHIGDAFARIGRVKTLLSELGDRKTRLPLRERCNDLLAGDAGSVQKRTELDTAMSALERLVQQVFLP